LHRLSIMTFGGTPMSLLDDLKQTVSGAASTARDVGQTLGAQAQAQLAIKRLQLEQARKYHELGTRTHEWHKAGTLIAAGPVPREVQELCLQLDDINRQLDDQTLKLEEAKRQAELRAETRQQNRTAPTVEATMTATPIDATSTPDTFKTGTSSAYTGAATAPVADVPTSSPAAPDVAVDIPAPTYVIDAAGATTPGADAATPSSADDPQTPSDPRPGNPTRPLPPS
jgi:hypothetical protein